MKFDKAAVIALLDEKGIEYEYRDHDAAFTLDEMMELELPHADRVAKNLFIRDDKKRNYYLVTICDGKRADLKKLREYLEERPLRFASENDLMKYMNLPKGSVTPFGILNDEERRVRVLMDEDFKDDLIGIHPNDNSASVWLDTEKVMDIIREHGNPCEYIKI